jgi:aminoglycoside phosphotransferase (APT) family kinase protein
VTQPDPSQPDPSQPDPPWAALAWAAEVAGSRTPARIVRPLLGGTHAVTHLVATERPEREMVLRRYPPGDRAAGREARVLDALDGLDGWAPRVLAADPTGSRFGQPAILLTRLRGHADITPASPRFAAEQLGHALARIHAAPLTGPLRDGMRAASPGGPGAPIIAADHDRLAAEERVLTHHDYWSGNVLWEQQTLTGIVDWSGAVQAPRGFDLGWCRLDLFLLHGQATADAFLAAYEQAANTTVPDIDRWDLFALTNSYRTVETWEPNYHSLGRTDLTAAELRTRHTSWTQDRLAH